MPPWRNVFFRILPQRAEETPEVWPGRIRERDGEKSVAGIFSEPVNALSGGYVLGLRRKRETFAGASFLDKGHGIE